MSSVNVCRTLQSPDPSHLWAMSSRQLDQQQKKPDGRMC